MEGNITYQPSVDGEAVAAAAAVGEAEALGFLGVAKTRGSGRAVCVAEEVCTDAWLF